ncbi:hypothetical protein M9H77_11363 [Catharanthus roseus]|uniref:Uncharacterized protein n=1 Tax=Catharanthus roseus TaxID=4058 RepID=A0ACC0BEB1_CATRO|nr:hypothetical protein M9H77_11363 [Catharanthus roseus]
MKRSELVLIPSPRIGHLVSSIEMAKILVNQDERLSMTIFIIKLPFDTDIARYTKSLSQSSIPRIKFIEFDQDEASSLKQFSLNLLFESIESHKGKLRDVLVDISNCETSKLVGVIIGMFCCSMLDVINEFEVPSYVFYTSSAAFLGLTFHFQRLVNDFHEDVTKYKDKNSDLAIPTYVNPVPIKVMPGLFFDKEEGKLFLDLARRYRETKGIIVNSFLELESHAVQVLSKDPNIPPVYAIGPVLNLESEVKNESELILKWLGIQPEGSVIFLCFGSSGSFSVKQVKEIAYALENSGHRFLWSLRRPPSEGKLEVPGDYESLEQVLPNGFLKRTAEMGKVIGWAPQVAVLSHSAVGGFVSHCGWNSTLESVWFGVPMATWPIYAEQQVNAFQLVKDLEIAVEIKMDYKKDFGMKTSEILNAELLEERIRCLMDCENEIRKRVKEMQRKSRLALKEGGSSYFSTRSFIDNVVVSTNL